VEDIALFLIGYLIGSILFGEILSRSKGVNIREVGSGNVGATNVARALGKKYGLIVFLLDMLKGFIPVLIAGLWTGWGSWGVAFAGTGAVSGHMFSLFSRFRGGKGVATAMGVVLAISWKMALLLIVVWGTVLAITRYVSVASTISAVSALVLFVIADYPPPLITMALIVSVLIVFKHRSNFQRLISGYEPKI